MVHSHYSPSDSEYEYKNNLGEINTILPDDLENFQAMFKPWLDYITTALNQIKLTIPAANNLNINNFLLEFLAQNQLPLNEATLNNNYSKDMRIQLKGHLQFVCHNPDKSISWFDNYGAGGIIKHLCKKVDWEDESEFDQIWHTILEDLERTQLEKDTARTLLFRFLQAE